MTAAKRSDPVPGAWTPQESTGAPSEVPLAASVEWPTPGRGWERREAKRPVPKPAAIAPEPAPVPAAITPLPTQFTPAQTEFTPLHADFAASLGAPAPQPSASAAPSALLTADPAELQNPTTPGFSADGRRWWDGTRWQTLEVPAAAAPARRRRRGLIVAVVVLAVVGLLVPILAAVVLPAVLSQGDNPLDSEIRQSLTYAHVAQQNHHLEHGMFASDVAGLQESLAGPLVPADGDVELFVVRATATEFCVAGAPVGADPRWYLDETGEISRRSCT